MKPRNLTRDEAEAKARGITGHLNARFGLSSRCRAALIEAMADLIQEIQRNKGRIDGSAPRGRANPLANPTRPEIDDGQAGSGKGTGRPNVPVKSRPTTTKEDE